MEDPGQGTFVVELARLVGRVEDQDWFERVHGQEGSCGKMYGHRRHCAVSCWGVCQ